MCARRKKRRATIFYLSFGLKILQKYHTCTFF